MDITEITIMHHVGIVLVGLWLLSFFNRCHPVAYFVSLIYIYLVHERYVMRLRRRLQFEQKKQAYQKRILTDSETVRWLNHAVEKIWPICLEQIASQKILLPIIPWFLEKYKPWTARKAVVQHLYLGRNPPLFTEMRVLGQCSGDDHLVLELGMNFLSADDMSAMLAVKLRKRLGFGMWAKLHLTGMHVEGKVLVGVKFLRQWPFLGRLRICFAEPPYFQMTVKPIFTHGLDVTVLPGIAGWLDKLLSLAFEQTLVQPNMLVVDMEKFASTQSDWFSVDERKSVAYAKVEVVEATDIKPSDLNGLADPYVKGQLGSYRFRTKIQRKTLVPKWHEEFKIPISTWESPNVLEIEVCDKDRFVDDTLGCCSVNINDLRDGERHVMWLSLKSIKKGRLNLAITVLEENAEGAENQLNKEEIRDNFVSETADGASFSSLPRQKSQKVADNFEPIIIEGQEETGVWVHHPGSEVLETWEPRKGKSRQLDAEIRGVPNESFGSSRSRASGSLNNENSASDEHSGEKNPMDKVRRGMRKITAVFHRNHKNGDDSGSSGEIVLSPYENIRSVQQKEIGVKFVVDDSLPATTPVKDLKVVCVSPEGSGPDSPGKGNVKDMAKSILKHAEKSARSIKHALSRKGSRKSRGDSSLVTEREIYPDTESSDDESLSSLHVQTVPDAANPISPCWGSADSNQTKESAIAQAGSNVPATNNEDQVGRVPTEDQERMEDEEVSSSNLQGNGLEDSSGTQPGEQNLDLEKSSDVRLEERI